MEGGADQALRDNDGYTPLHAVAQWGKLKVTQRLLELNLDVNGTYLGDPAQWCKDFSLLLLERGADPGIRDNDGQTPLHVASHEGNLTVIQQLLKFDIDVNSHNSQGQTPFQLAMEGGTTGWRNYYWTMAQKLPNLACTSPTFEPPQFV